MYNFSDQEFHKKVFIAELILWTIFISATYLLFKAACE